ncbi:MAG: hypothetical protein EOM05_05260 [Clostridia bacterium]|nr:hypothetical protein [Clostridia bacterium]
MLAGLPIKANKKSLNYYVEEFTDSQGNKYKVTTNLDSKINTIEVYENNALSYTFESNDNDKVYLIDPSTNLRTRILYFEDIGSLTNTFSLTRAGSEWILTSSAQLKN